MYSIPLHSFNRIVSRAKFIQLVLVLVIVLLLCKQITIRWIQQYNEYRIRTISLTALFSFSLCNSQEKHQESHERNANVTICIFMNIWMPFINLIYITNILLRGYIFWKKYFHIRSNYIKLESHLLHIVEFLSVFLYLNQL